MIDCCTNAFSNEDAQRIAEDALDGLGVATLLLAHEELPRTYRQGSRESVKKFHGWGLSTRLNLSYVVLGDSGGLGKVGLGETESGSKVPDVLGKDFVHGRHD